jgi:hypothetical protein
MNEVETTQKIIALKESEINGILRDDVEKLFDREDLEMPKTMRAEAVLLEKSGESGWDVAKG